MNFYIYAMSFSNAKKVLNFLEENKITHNFATFSEADCVLGFTNLHVIQVFLTDAEANKYLADLENFRLSATL